MKSVLITGGSRGIGKELVKRFIQESYKVFYTYNTTAPDLSLDNCVAIKCDLRSDDDIRELLLYLKDNGGVELLINNAAVEYNDAFYNKTRDSFREAYDVNVIAPFILSREIGRVMYERKKGKIINISSNNSIDKYDPSTLEYDCSKAALNILTKTLAKEFSPFVNVNAVLPGWILTERIKELDDSLDNMFIKEESSNNLLNRFATCEDICNLVLFLASDKSDYINGELIRIDGGNK